MGSKFPTSLAFNTLSFNSWFRKYRFCTQGPQLSSCTLPDHWLLLLSHSAVSDSLQLHGLQHPRLPCSLPSPGVCSNSCPSSQRCHPTILSSVIPFSSCLQSFPASGSFPMSWLFASGGQSIGASTSASALPMTIQRMVTSVKTCLSPCKITESSPWDLPIKSHYWSGWRWLQSGSERKRLHLPI